MRILILSSKLPFPGKDGGSIAVMNLAAGFSKLDHHVHILSMSTRKHPVKNIPEDIKRMFNISTVAVNTNINLFKAFLNIFSAVPYIVKRFYSSQFNNKLAELLMNNDFDIIQFEGLYLTQYLHTAKKHAAALKSLRAHNVEHEIWQRIFNKRSLFFRLLGKGFVNALKKYELRMMNRFDTVVPISKRDEMSFEKYGINKPMHVTPFAIDLSSFKQPDIKHDQSIFYIGALDWRPNQEGLDWFIDEVWPGVISKKPAAKFFIAGRHCPYWLKNKINSKGQNMVFKGEVEDAGQFMRLSPVMVVPLFAGSGMRIKIIEAMAQGRTVITSSVGLEGINAADQHDVFIADNKDQFIDIVISLLDNQEQLEKTGSNAFQFVKQNFDIFACTSSLIDFYKDKL